MRSRRDPCGQAGGKYKQTPMGGDSNFKTVTANGTTYTMGDLGSMVLPEGAFFMLKTRILP